MGPITEQTQTGLPLHPLLLTRDDRWSRAVKAAARHAGADGLDEARSAQEAMRRLVSRPNWYSHLLVEPESAGILMSDLTGLTIGEAHTGTALILLGARRNGPPNAPVVPAPDLASVSAALSPDVAEAPPTPPTLSDMQLERALTGNCVDARFQPIVRVADRQPAGVEILARLRHPRHGVLSPDLFVPQSERAGLSEQLTMAVARRAFATLPAAVATRQELFITLNLPLDVILVPDALQAISVEREKAGIPARRVLIELTESRPVDDVSSLAHAVEQWRAAGYRLAIDDAGPEIANLRALYRLPFTTVKLDRGIVQLSASNAHAMTYLDRTVRLAHGYGMQVIAEGVETEADWDRVAALGIDQVQGFLVSRPLPARALVVWLETWIRSQVPQF